MSDWELKQAREWDANSSTRLSSTVLSVASNDNINGHAPADDGFVTVEARKNKNPTRGGRPGPIPQRLPVVPPAPVNTRNGNARGQATRGQATRGTRGTARGARGGRANVSGGAGRPLPTPAPPPQRSDFARPDVMNAAQHSCNIGEANSDTFSFSIPRRACQQHLQSLQMNFRRELSTICRRCEIWLVESETDPCAVLLWGEDGPIRQAIMQLEALDYRIRPEKWAKSQAYDGRKESRKDLMAIEEEQAARLEALAGGQVFPYEYVFIWPDGDLDLQQLIAIHDQPRGPLGRIRSMQQCSITCHPEKNMIVFQGMIEAEVMTAARTMITLAKSMVTEMASYVKLSLIAPFQNTLEHQAVVSLDDRIELHPAMYRPPGYNSGTQASALIVSCPKVWSLPPSVKDIGRALFGKVMRRVDRFNQGVVIDSLKKALANLNFASKGVQMRVNLGQLALVTYARPPDGQRHHSLETFRRAIAKDRTDILLRGMPSDVDLRDVVAGLREHPAFRSPNRPDAIVTESYGVSFDFRPPGSDEVLRHEQEYRRLAENEMEQRVKRWSRLHTNRSSVSPMVLSMLDFEKLDWQLRLETCDVLGNRNIGPEFVKFAGAVSVKDCFKTSAIVDRAVQRAIYPTLGYPYLLRVTNKPTIRFELARTNHVLEISREDIYEGDCLRTSMPKSPTASKWSASFHYPGWDGALSEFLFLDHGEKPSWDASLSTFFPDSSNDDTPDGRAGVLEFLNEVEEVKQILWEVIQGSEKGRERIGVTNDLKQNPLKPAANQKRPAADFSVVSDES